MGAEHDEREQVRLSLEGQAEAFTSLVRQHQQMVHALTYRMTGSMTEAVVAVLQINVKETCRRDPAAQVRFAQIFEEGVLTKRDHPRAYFWYSIAARQCASGAATRRDEIKSRLITEDLSAEDEWIKRYAEPLRRSN